MSIKVNQTAVAYAKQLIQDGKIKNDSGHWHEHNPDTAAENKFLEKHEIEEYSKWHLGLDTSKGEDTKGRS